MKKAVGHLVPFMEKEREEELAKSGGVANDNVPKLYRVLTYVVILMLEYIIGPLCRDGSVGHS